MDTVPNPALYIENRQNYNNQQNEAADGEENLTNTQEKLNAYDKGQCYLENMQRYAENIDRYADNIDRFVENSPSPASMDDNDSSHSFSVDLTDKGTNLAGKSFTIAAILGLTNSEEDVINLSVQERLQANQRHLQNYLYANHDISKFNSNSFCRSVVGLTGGLRQDNPRREPRQPLSQMKNARTHSIPCSNSSSVRNKRIRTIFTPEQLERLEAEFERQQYMVGPERLYLAHALQLTEAQVKVWFQNRRIKWRKHHLEVTQQRLAVLQRHRADDDA